MNLTLITVILLSLISSLSVIGSPLPLGVFALSFAFVLVWLTVETLSSWFGFIVMVVYVSGLLVMFAYFLAICPNQLVNFNEPVKVFLTGFVMYGIVVSGFLEPFVPLANVPFPIAGMFSSLGAVLLLLLGGFLLFTLIVVVKVACRSRGPLRPFKEGV